MGVFGAMSRGKVLDKRVDSVWKCGHNRSTLKEGLFVRVDSARSQVLDDPQRPQQYSEALPAFLKPPDILLRIPRPNGLLVVIIRIRAIGQ